MVKTATDSFVIEISVNVDVFECEVGVVRWWVRETLTVHKLLSVWTVEIILSGGHIPCYSSFIC